MGGYTETNQAMDCLYRDSGLVVWWAKKLRPGDKCRRWCFWNMQWDTVTVEKNRQEDQTIEIEKAGGSDFESYYRLRPLWWPVAQFSYIALVYGPILAKALGAFAGLSWWIICAPILAETAIAIVGCTYRVAMWLWKRDN